MISKPFTIDVVKTFRLFYVLDKITGDSVSLYRRTPAGDDLFEDAEVFTMQDGHLLVAIEHPFKYAGNNCLIAKSGDIEEIVNLTAWERLVDLYNTEIDNTQQGIFVFCKSEAIFDPEMEWRCDNTTFGPRVFDPVNSRPVTGNNVIIAIETFLSVPGVGHFLYIHMKNDEEIREQYKNDSVIPISGFTLSELFKVVYEWSETAKEPFNNTEDVAVKAESFLSTFGFSPSLVDNQVDMQVAKYIQGDTQARLRPEGVQANKPELVNFVKKNMAGSSLAALSLLYPGIWDTQELLNAEQEELNAGVSRFRDYYEIPPDWQLDDVGRIVDHCVLNTHSTIGPFVHNQLRLFSNKQAVLDQTYLA